MPHRYWTSFAPRAPGHSHCCAAWTNHSCGAVRVFEGYGPVTLAALVHYLCSHDQQHLAGLQCCWERSRPVAGEYPATVAGAAWRWHSRPGRLAGATGARWCLGFGSLGPVRTGMTVEQVLRLADWPGMERKQPAGECWYLRYHAGGANFDLMVIKRASSFASKFKGESTLQTFSGAHVASTEAELARLYGRLEFQPHRYDSRWTYADLEIVGWSDYGLRFETSHGKVTAIQSGPWEHLQLRREDADDATHRDGIH